MAAKEHVHTPPPPPAHQPRRWRRRVLRSALALLLCALIAVMARNMAAARILPAVLGPALGLDVALDAIHIGLDGTIALSGLRGASPAEWTPVRRLAIPEMRVRIAPWTLLSRGIEGIASVQITGGVLELDLTRSGPPETKAPDGSMPRLPAALPALDLGFASIVIHGPELEAALDELSVTSQPAHGASPFTIAGAVKFAHKRYEEQARIVCEGVYLDGSLHDLSLRADDAPLIHSGMLRTPNIEGALHLALFGGSVAGEIQITADGELDLAVRAEQVDIAHLADLLDRLGVIESPLPGEGRLNLSATLRLPLETPREVAGRLTADIGGAKAAGAALPRLQLAASCGRGVLHVPTLDAESHGLEIRGRDLRASLAAPTTAKVLQSITGTVAVSVSDLAAAAEPFLPAAPLPSAAGGASLTAFVRIADGAAAADILRIKGPGMLLEFTNARASLDIEDPARSHVDIEGRLRIDDLALLDDMATTPLAGTAELAFSAGGTLGAPRADLRLTAASVRVAGLDIARLAAAIEADFDALRILSLDLNTTAPEGVHVSLQGSMRLDPVHFEGLRIVCRGDRLQALTSLAGIPPELSATATPTDAAPPADAETPAAPPLLPGGPFVLTATIDGPLAWPDGDVALRLDGPSPSHVTLAKRGNACTWTVRDLCLADVAVSADMETEIDPSFRSGSLTLHRLEAAAGAARWVTPHPAALRFDLASQRVTVDPPLIVESSVGRVEMHAAQRAGAIEARLLAQADADLGFMGWVMHHPRLALDAVYAPGEDLAPPVIRATVQFQADAIEAPPATGALAGGPLRASCALDTTASPPALDITLDASQVTLAAIGDRQPLRQPFTGSAAVAIAWHGDRVQVTRGTLTMAEAGATAAGWVELDMDPAAAIARLDAPRLTRYALQLDTHGDLSALRELLPDLRTLQGHAALNARLEGTPSAPDLQATLAVKDGEVHLGGLPRLNALNARLAMAGDRIAIEGFGGELGGSPFTLSGQITGLPDTPRFDITASGDNLLLARTDNVRIRADTRLRLHTEDDILAATGTIAITDGRVLRDLPLADALSTLVRRARTALVHAPSLAPTQSVGRTTAGLALFSLEGRPLEDMRFDLRITAREPIVLRSNLLRGTCRPDLALRGTGRHPVLEGNLYLDDVIAFLPATRLRAASGVVRFDVHNPLFPEIHMTAESRIRGYDVTVVISGPINNPLIEFSSSPPLPADRLVLLVTTGHAPGAEDATSEKAALLTVAQYFGQDLLRTLFGREQIDDEESLLERFEFEAGRNVSRSGNETWEALFLLKRAFMADRDMLYLTGDRDQFDHYNVGVRIVFHGD